MSRTIYKRSNYQTDLVVVMGRAEETDRRRHGWLDSLLMLLLLFLVMAVVGIQLGSQWLMVSFGLPQSPHKPASQNWGEKPFKENIVTKISIMLL